MNLNRLYARFIESRRSATSFGPTENHHVIPRSLGGADDPSNLVALSLDEHLFAHLLLARIHGEDMAVGLFLMASRKRFAKRASRLAYQSMIRAGRKRLQKNNPFLRRPETAEKRIAGIRKALKDPEQIERLRQQSRAVALDPRIRAIRSETAKRLNAARSGRFTNADRD